MTFINITFGYHQISPQVFGSQTFTARLRSLRFSVLGSKIGPFHLNDLKCFKSPTCSVVLVVASPKYVPGEQKLEKWFLQLYFWICFLEDFDFFLQIGCWLLNCMCKWDTISGMFGCSWIFRNISTGNLFLAKKGFFSASSQGKIQWVAHTQTEKNTHIPLQNRWMSWLYHVKQVYTSWIW